MRSGRAVPYLLQNLNHFRSSGLSTGEERSGRPINPRIGRGVMLLDWRREPAFLAAVTVPAEEVGVRRRGNTGGDTKPDTKLMFTSQSESQIISYRGALPATSRSGAEAWRAGSHPSGAARRPGARGGGGPAPTPGEGDSLGPRSWRPDVRPDLLEVRIGKL